jgi:hypothetical protein
MNGQALRIAVAGGLFLSSTLFSSPLAAQPLRDLEFRLASLRSDQPIRVKVDVELEHQGKAPLHLDSNKQRGRVVVEGGPHGLRVREQKRTGSSFNLSLWGPETAASGPLVADADALVLIDPAGWIVPVLHESIVVEDQESSWEGKPARLLVLRPADLPAELAPARTSTDGEPRPLIAEVRIWLDPDGLPVALERTGEIQLPGLTTTRHQTLTFQQAGGRLLVRRSTETFSGTALAALHGSDSRKMKVTVD